MVDCIEIIKKYYAEGSDAYNMLVTHSRQVADLAIALADRCPELEIDKEYVYEASMLHDIGIYKTNAPGIFCYGELPYLCHGLEGKAILEREGLLRHALVCERHIGAGLTAQEIESQGLPLVAQDMLPITLEEKLVCYADNFYSKSRITAAKPLEKVRESMSKFGEGTMTRLEEMVALFGSPDGLGL